MTRVLLILGHGREKSLCQHLAQVALSTLEEQRAEWRMHDLLADGFDPVLRLEQDQRHAPALSSAEDPLVARYQQDVQWAQAYVVIHPIWWFAPPAILKGWVDRVLVDGVALAHDAEPPAGLLGGRSALVVQTFNAPRIVDRLLMRRISMRFWTTAVFGSVGVRRVTPLALFDAGKLSSGRLKRFEGRLRRSVTELAGRVGAKSEAE